MRKCRRIQSALLSAAMLITFLSGCSFFSDDSTANELKTVTVWSGNSHSKIVISRLVNEFNKTRGKELNIQIDYIVKGETQDAEYIEAFERGEEPDFCSGGLLETLAAQEKIVAIEDLPGGKEFLAEYPAETYENFVYEGKTYKAPYGATTLGLIYNKDLFKKYGIVDENGEAKPPETLAEVREYAKRMTNPAEMEYGFIVRMRSVTTFGVDVANIAKASADTVEYDWKNGRYDYSANIPVLEMYRGMQEDGSIFPDTGNMDNDAARAIFAQGKIGMKFGASYDVGVFNDQFPAKCDWGVAMIPTVNPGERYKTNNGGTGFLMVTKRGVDRLGKELAMEIFKWFHNDEMMTKLYQAGMEIPCKPELVENTQLTNPPKGWKEFAQITYTSYVESWNVPKTVRPGEMTTNEYYLQKFWTGEMEIDEMIQEMNESFNAGLERWYAENPEVDRSIYIKSDFDTKVYA